MLTWLPLVSKRCAADSSSQKKMPLAVGATSAAPASRCGPGEICRCCQYTVAELSDVSQYTLVVGSWFQQTSPRLYLTHSPTRKLTHSLTHSLTLTQSGPRPRRLKLRTRLVHSINPRNLPVTASTGAGHQLQARFRRLLRSRMVRCPDSRSTVVGHGRAGRTCSAFENGFSRTLFQHQHHLTTLRHDIRH